MVKLLFFFFLPLNKLKLGGRTYSVILMRNVG